MERFQFRKFSEFSSQRMFFLQGASGLAVHTRTFKSLLEDIAIEVFERSKKSNIKQLTNIEQ